MTITASLSAIQYTVLSFVSRLMGLIGLFLFKSQNLSDVKFGFLWGFCVCCFLWFLFRCFFRFFHVLFLWFCFLGFVLVFLTLILVQLYQWLWWAYGYTENYQIVDWCVCVWGGGGGGGVLIRSWPNIRGYDAPTVNVFKGIIIQVKILKVNFKNSNNYINKCSVNK